MKSIFTFLLVCVWSAASHAQSCSVFSTPQVSGLTISTVKEEIETVVDLHGPKPTRIDLVDQRSDGYSSIIELSFDVKIPGRLGPQRFRVLRDQETFKTIVLQGPDQNGQVHNYDLNLLARFKAVKAQLDQEAAAALSRRRARPAQWEEIDLRPAD